MATDFNQMVEEWVEGIPDTPASLAVQSDIVEARLAAVEANVLAIQNHVHPALEKGGHMADQIHEDNEGQDVEEFMREVVEARLGFDTLDDLLSISTIGGETLSRVYELNYTVSPASAHTMGFLDPWDALQELPSFSLELPAANTVDPSKPARMAVSLSWSDGYGADRLRTPWRAFLNVNGQLAGEITDLFPSSPDSPLQGVLPVAGGLLQNGANTVTLSFQAPPARPANRIYGNQNNSTERSVPRWVTHQLVTPTDASAVRLIVYRSGSNAGVVLTEFQIFSQQTLLEGLTAQATSEMATREAYHALDTSINDAGSWYSAGVPSYSQPQILLARLGQTVPVDLVRMLSLASLNGRQPMDYEIQVSTHPDVAIDDPVDDPKWLPVDLTNGFDDGSEAARVTDGTDADIDYLHVSTALPVLAYPTETVTLTDLQVVVVPSDQAILFDARRDGVYWPKVFWDSIDPDGSSLTFEGRVGEDNPPMGAPQAVPNGGRVLGQGRYLSLIPTLTPNSAGEYPRVRSVNAFWLPDPDGNIKADLFSLQVNLVRINWELRRYKASLQSTLTRLLMDVFRDASGIDPARSSNYVREVTPEAFGMAPLDPAQPCVITTEAMPLPEDPGRILLLADAEGTLDYAVSRDDGVTWEAASSGGTNFFAGLPSGNLLRLRFTLAPDALLRAWAVYY